MDLNKLQKYYFPGRQEGEQIIIALKRHKIVIGKKISGFIFGLAIPLALYLVADRFTNWLDDTSSLLYIIIIFVFSLMYLYLLLFIYHSWVDYYLDVWLVTNERIIAMEQKGLFNRVVSELRLNRIQDVSSEVRGFLATIFKYGRIRIQTASEIDRFEFLGSFRYGTEYDARVSRRRADACTSMERQNHIRFS